MNKGEIGYAIASIACIFLLVYGLVLLDYSEE